MTENSYDFIDSAIWGFASTCAKKSMSAVFCSYYIYLSAKKSKSFTILMFCV
jgi:hypothetical protein